MTGSLRCALVRAARAVSLCALAGASLFSGPLHGADVFWEGDDATDPTDWAVPQNWLGGVVPGGADSAYVNNGRTAQVKSDVGLINELHVAGGSRLEIVGGGNLLPDGAINVGDVAGESAELVVTGGSLDGFTTANFATNGGQATVRQTAGAVVYSNDTVTGTTNAGMQLGAGVGAVGVYNLEGGDLRQVTSGSVDDGNSWNYIGRGGGAGTFNLSGGTASFNARTHLGIDAGSTGTVNQSGGLFEVRGHELVIADGNATGIYNLTGGTLKVTGDGRDIQVGHWENSHGELNVSGGRVETRDINLGNYRGSQGSMEISGDADIQVNGWMRVGAGENTFVGQAVPPIAQGHVVQTGGRVNINGQLLVGDKATSEGVYDLSGGEVHAGDWSFIGGRGEGYGDNGTPDDLTDDRLAGAGKGTFNLSGTGLLNVRSRLHVGGEFGGQGVLNQTGGTLHVEKIVDGGGAITNVPDMLVGDGRKAKGEYNLSGGEATVDRDMLIGNWANTEGHVNVSGGALNVGQHLIVGGGTDTDANDIGNDRIPGTADDDFRAPNHGFLKITDGTVRVNNDLVLGDGFTANGQVDMEGGELTIGQWTYIGRGYLDDAGTIYESNGTFNMTGGHATFEARVGIGVNGNGTLNQTGGRIDYTDAKGSGIAFHIGDQATGHGEYNLSGGEAIVSGGRVQIGHWRGQDAKMNVSGTGLLRTSTDVHVGSEVDVQEQLTAVNHGILNQSGGVIDIGGNLIVGVFDRSNGEVNLSGGEMHNRNNVTVADAGLGTFTHTGGTHTIDGDLTIGAQAIADGLYTLDDDGVLDMTGGAMNYGAGLAQFAFEGGTLKDAGTINFTLVNNGGTLAPGASPGVTSIVGDYSVTSSSATYQVEIAGLLQGSEYDFLNVSGATSLGGRLQVLLTGGDPVLGDTNGDNVVDLDDLNNVRNNFGTNGNGDTNGDGIVDLDDLNNVRNNFGAEGTPGFVPEIGDSFTILASAGGITGTFSNTLLPALPAGRIWNVSYQPNDVRLDVLGAPAAVPEPATFSLLGCMFAVGAGWWLRRRRL